MNATCYGYDDVVTLLLEAGANMNLRDEDVRKTDLCIDLNWS
jgi:ankyrin repeat protein